MGTNKTTSRAASGKGGGVLRARKPAGKDVPAQTKIYPARKMAGMAAKIATLAASAARPVDPPLVRGLAPSHPGVTLRTVILPDLKAKGIAKAAVAAGLGISRQTLEDLVQERQGVTPEMALRLAKYLRGRPEFWLDLQRRWDLARAAEKIGDQLAAIKPLPADVISA